MAGAGIGGGSTLGTTVEVSEIESLTDGHIIIGDGSGAPTTRAAFASSTGNFTPGTPIMLPAGTDSACALQLNDANTGFYNSLLGTEQTVDLVVNGTRRIAWRTTIGMEIDTSLIMAWTSGGIGTSADAGLSRNAAGVVEVNNGTAGTLRRLKVGFGAVDAPAIVLDDGRGIYGANGGVAVTGPSSAVQWIPQSTGHGLTVAANGFLAFSQTSSDASATVDTGLYRNAAGVVEINNGTAGTFRDIKVREYLTDGANGSSSGYTLLLDELVTIAAAATTVTSATLPAGCTPVHVACRVTVAIPTAATWDIGVAGATTRYGTGIAVAANTTNTVHGAAGSIVHILSAIALTITPNLTPADNTGRVRVKVWGFRATAPTA